jgi:hypothetical protein
MLPDPMSPDAVKHVVAVRPVNFRKDHKPDPKKPGELIEVHRVDLVKMGSGNHSTPWNIEALKKDTILWPAVKPAYEAWLSGQEEPPNGTPLDAWPGVTKGQVERFRLLHLRSVEDLANVTDPDMERIGMGARALREKARAYVKAKEGTSVMAEALAERDALIADQGRELAELRALIETATADKPKREKPSDVAKGQ